MLLIEITVNKLISEVSLNVRCMKCKRHAIASRDWHCWCL